MSRTYTTYGHVISMATTTVTSTATTLWGPNNVYGTNSFQIKNTGGTHTLYVSGGTAGTADATDATAYFVSGAVSPGSTFTCDWWNGPVAAVATSSTTILYERISRDTS